jgi:hypothetical protein
LDTTPPVFFPPIRISHENGYLVASWDVGSFSDPDDPFPLSLQIAIGKKTNLKFFTILFNDH